MSASLVTYAPEAPEHDAAIEAINEEAFGPGRFARAAYKIREAGGHDAAFSFVALQDGEVIASVRQTPVVAGKGRALLLGPLAVRPDHKSQGHGRKLVGIALDAARAAGAPAVLLVGDEPYYGPLGFRKVPRGRLTLPRPVDPERLLVCELAEGGAEELAGEVVHASQAAVQ